MQGHFSMAQKGWATEDRGACVDMAGGVRRRDVAALSENGLMGLALVMFALAQTATGPAEAAPLARADGGGLGRQWQQWVRGQGRRSGLHVGAAGGGRGR